MGQKLTSKLLFKLFISSSTILMHFTDFIFHKVV